MKKYDVDEYDIRLPSGENVRFHKVPLPWYRREITIGRIGILLLIVRIFI